MPKERIRILPQSRTAGLRNPITLPTQYKGTRGQCLVNSDRVVRPVKLLKMIVWRGGTRPRKGKDHRKMNPMAMRVTEMGASEGCPVTGGDRGCVARLGQDHLAGNGADFLLVLNSRTFEEPMHEAKQMTTGQPVGAASHTANGIPPPCESAASQINNIAWCHVTTALP